MPKWVGDHCLIDLYVSYHESPCLILQYSICVPVYSPFMSPLTPGVGSVLSARKGEEYSQKLFLELKV